MPFAQLRSRLIFVREDREDKELLAATGGTGGGGRARGHGGEPSPKAGRSLPGSYSGAGASVVVGRKVFVTGLARSTTWQVRNTLHTHVYGVLSCILPSLRTVSISQTGGHHHWVM